MVLAAAGYPFGPADDPPDDRSGVPSDVGDGGLTPGEYRFGIVTDQRDVFGGDDAVAGEVLLDGDEELGLADDHRRNRAAG